MYLYNINDFFNFEIQYKMYDFNNLNYESRSW